MVVEFTPSGITHLGWRYFIIWAAVCLGLLFPVTYFFFPETTGHSLEDIDRIFRLAKGPLDLVRVSKSVRQDKMGHHVGITDISELEAADKDAQADKSGVLSYEVEKA